MPTTTTRPRKRSKTKLTIALRYAALLPHIRSKICRNSAKTALAPKLNPTVVVLSILFWSSLWGVLGTFIAVPFLICLKIICEHSEALRPVSDFLE